MGTTVRGPIVGGAHGWPFAAARVDLARHDYVEQEWFFTGRATRYRPLASLGDDGRWPVERDGDEAFTTRALVRHPLDPARFNGTVLVEWNNVSAGIEITEAGEGNVIFEEGFAWVGVSAQVVGVHGFPHDPHGLTTWDPQRYGELRIEDDALSYGIFTEVARALGQGPLGGLTAERLLAIGGSQSAGRLVTYINAVHPVEGVFDGFVPFTWFGSGTSVDDRATLILTGDSLAPLTVYPTRIRDDLDVPVLVVNSECEASACWPVRQPDTDMFRFWEVAGSPHAPRLHMERIMAKLVRDGVALPGAEAMDLSALSPVRWAPVLDAGIGLVHHWIRGGPPPPSQPLIEMQAGEPPRVVRDADGNAVGGVRVPELEVAIDRHVADRVEAGAAGLMGIRKPLPADVVRERYPDREVYLAAHSAATERALAAGVLRASDAAEGIERAGEVTLPSRVS